MTCSTIGKSLLGSSSRLCILRLGHREKTAKKKIFAGLIGWLNDCYISILSTLEIIRPVVVVLLASRCTSRDTSQEKNSDSGGT